MTRPAAARTIVRCGRVESTQPIAFAIAAYVVMDGFDLGIGILFPLLKPGKPRDQAMNSVAPVCASPNPTKRMMRFSVPGQSATIAKLPNNGDIMAST